MFCSTCGDERLFEQPPCVDGHGADCPERACVDCGEAVLIGTPLLGAPEPSREIPGRRAGAGGADTRAA